MTKNIMMSFQKYLLLSLLLTSLFVIALQSNQVTAQTAGICDRTQPIQHLLLAKLNLADCNIVTATNLASITGELNWKNQSIKTIASTDFKGLSSLTGLNLFGNQLSNIPFGAFRGLAATNINLKFNNLQSLPLNLLTTHANPSSITNLDFGLQLDIVKPGRITYPDWEITNVSWVQDRDNLGDFTLQLGHALPQDITVYITSSNGNLSLPSIIIPKGSTVSSKVTWTATSSDTYANLVPIPVQIDVDALDGHIHIPSLAVGGICDRTPIIQNFLLAQLNTTDCAVVTDQHLTSINGIFDLQRRSISTIGPTDFKGLVNVYTIDLSDNRLTTIPAAAFASLNRLEHLFLYDNRISDIQAGAFDSLIRLRTLTLDNNLLTTIPAGTFDELRNLRTLFFDSNGLLAIPTAAFDGLRKLTNLHLRHNSLTTIPADAFDALSNLYHLDLNSNQISSIGTDTFANLTAKSIDLGNNNLTSLPINLLASHKNPAWLNNFNLSFNPLTNDSWEITHVRWVQNNTDPNSFSLQLDHALPLYWTSQLGKIHFVEDLTINITSSNGNLSAPAVVIPKGKAISNAVTWTATSSDTKPNIVPTTKLIYNYTLGGHINIPELGMNNSSDYSASTTGAKPANQY